MKQRRLFSCLLWAAVAVTAGWLFSARPAAAHTAGAIQLMSAPAGDFLLTVWTAPEPPRVGELHVIVSASLAADGAMVLDDTLLIEVTAVAGLEPPLIDQATRAKSDNKFLYEATLQPANAAWYQVRVAVSHPELAGGEVYFNVEVLPATTFNWLLVGPGSIALLIVGGWLAFRYRRARRQPGDAP